MAPGWYLDPVLPATLRWWDGAAWTGYLYPQFPVAAPALPAESSPHDPTADLAGELKSGRRASLAVVANAAVMTVSFFVTAVAAGKVIHQFRDDLRQAQNQSDQPVKFHSLSPAASLASNLIGLLSLAFQILLWIWIFRSATLARRAGLPARRSPMWAVVGFWLPVVNLWFPYRSASDLFPPGDDARRIVKFWWAFTLAQEVIVIPIIVLSAFSVPAAIGLAALASLVPWAAAVYTRRLISAAARTHASLIHGYSAVDEGDRR
jgi:hypothetical protein